VNGSGGWSQRLTQKKYLTQLTVNFEFDADRLAVKLMTDAGYDPQALVRWLRSFPLPKMNLPDSSDRIAAVKRAIEGVR
jgi:predicted Zn-dependent protease